MAAGIYIVEDSFIVSLHLQRTLESEGYQVVGTADSGEVALDQITALHPDLVLMDIMLTGKLDGVQTAAVIKDSLGIPVIFITALTDRETVQRAKISEPYGYLTKPFEDRGIFTVVEMALYKSAIERKLRQSEQKFFSTLKSISDGVITIDNSYSITYANPSAEAMIGIAAQHLQGRCIFDVIRLKDPIAGNYPINPIQCGIESGPENTWPDYFLLMSADGRETPVMDGTINPLTDSKGTITGMVLTFKNGTDKLERLRFDEEMERERLAALIEGQEQERTRIAKDLHDGLGQMLNAIKMKITTSLAHDEKATGLYTLLDDAIGETKRISENLQPHKLRDFDLVVCISDLCKELQSDTEAQIIFSAFVDDLNIDEAVKINLYRIAQEALSNAIRHAQAKQISVQLNDDENFLRLTVEDDGRGMMGYENPKGRGLINMSDRAHIIHGTCTLESDNSRGTILIVEIPKQR